jgi:sugar-phosphatase
MMRAVLADLDGVLVDSTAATARVWWAWAVEHGLDPERVAHFSHGRPSADTVRQVAPALDPDAEAARLEAAQVADTEGVIALPGARELMAAPPGPFAVVTSCPDPLARARLGAAGLPLPAVLVTRDRVRRGKPDPEPYLTAAAILGVDPAACLVLEDAVAGVEAGRAAGMTVIGVLTTHAPGELAGADVLIGDLTELDAALRASQFS